MSSLTVYRPVMKIHNNFLSILLAEKKPSGPIFENFSSFFKVLPKYLSCFDVSQNAQERRSLFVGNAYKCDVVTV